MLQDVTMEDIPCSSNVEWEGFALMVAKFGSYNSYHFSWSKHDVHKQFLFFHRLLITHRNLIVSDVYLSRDMADSPGFKHSILSLPIISILVKLEFKSFDNLEIYQMNVNRMIVHRQVDDVKLINFTFFKRCSLTSHTDGNSINHYT